MNYIGIYNTDMWETKQMFPSTHIGKASSYGKHKELLQGQFPTLPQTQELQLSPMVMLTQRAHRFNIKTATSNEEIAGPHSQTNKRKCSGWKQRTKQAVKCNRNAANNGMVVTQTHMAGRQKVIQGYIEARCQITLEH
jgi:hypothetical protein